MNHPNTNNRYFDGKESNSFLSPTVTQYGSHMVMTNVSRETKKKYWNIDTQFRDDYQNISLSQLVFTLPQSIPNVNSISVVNAEIPISFSNISANLGNNSIQITRVSDGAISKLVLPDGWYTLATLKSAINSKLTTLGLTGLSYDISTNNISTFTASSDSYVLTFATTSTTTSSGFDKYDVKSRLGWQLGFRDISYTVTSLLVSTAVIDILRPRYLYLVVDEFSGNTPNSFVSPLTTSVLNKNILAKITMDYSSYSFGSLLPANLLNGYLYSDVRKYGGMVNLQRLRIQLVNEYGAAVDLNGQDFSFCLEIQYE